MTSPTTIRIETEARGVATLTLARPERHNAFDAVMIRELAEAAVSLGNDPAIRVVILRAEGESFCAGGDLGWMQAQFRATRADRLSEARSLAHMLRALNTMPKPLIGRIHGPAYGGGVGLAAVCDTAIASTGAKFGLTETRLGLIPATIGPYVAAKLGESASRRVFMSGRIFSVDEAVQHGLIASAVAPAQLDDAIAGEVRAYLNVAPGAVASAKRLLHQLTNSIDDAVIEHSAACLADAWDTPEAQEGVTAFFEKRKPNWSIQG